MLDPKLVFKFKHQLLPAYTSWGRDFLDDLVFPICKARVTRRISAMELRVLNKLMLGNSLQQCQKSWIKLFFITGIFKSPLHGKTLFHHDGKYPRYLKYKAKALQFAQWFFFFVMFLGCSKFYYIVLAKRTFELFFPDNLYTFLRIINYLWQRSSYCQTTYDKEENILKFSEKFCIKQIESKMNIYCWK